MFWEFYKNPKKGEVYNAGGGRRNSISVIEAINKIKTISNKKWNFLSITENAREGDHMWYITDFSKFQNDFPQWSISYDIDQIIEQLVNYESSVS